MIFSWHFAIQAQASLEGPPGKRLGGINCLDALGFLDFKLSTEKLNKQALRVQDMIPLLMLLVVWAFGKVGPGIWTLEKS